MKQLKSLVWVLALAAILTACAGPNPLTDVASAEMSSVAGFFSGLVHGFIVLFSLLGSLIDDSITIYEVHNSGATYNIGFVIGAWAFFS